MCRWCIVTFIQTYGLYICTFDLNTANCMEDFEKYFNLYDFNLYENRRCLEAVQVLELAFSVRDPNVFSFLTLVS